MKVKVYVSTEYEVEIDDKFAACTGDADNALFEELVQSAENAVYNYRLSGKRIPDWEVDSIWSDDYTECLWEQY